MRLHNFLFVLLLGLSSALAAQSESELQMMYMGILEKEGLSGKVDSDGDVQFKYEDHTYFFGVSDSDLSFYRVVLPNIWPIESELERLKVLKAVNEVNETKKVVKAYVVNDNVWLTVELFVSDPEDFKKHFMRQIRAIESSTSSFVELMNE